ncbi:MAG: pilin [Patescibacteria group bacterium]
MITKINKNNCLKVKIKSLLVFCFLIFLLSLFACPVLASNPAGNSGGSGQYAEEVNQEQASAEETIDPNSVMPKINIKFGSTLVGFDPVVCDGTYCTVPWISQYIAAIYRYVIGAAGILAMVMIMVGGFIWLMSAGSPDKVGKAKEFITAALTGLFLALFSFLILNSVNPRLTNLEPLRIQDVEYIAPTALDSFGAGFQSEANVSKNPGTYSPGRTLAGSTDMTGLAKSAIDGIDKYKANGCTKSSGWRNDGVGSRHQSGRAVDFSMTDDCKNYITTNGQEIPAKLPNGSPNPEAPTWGTAYKMPDGSYWVDENISVTGGSGPHFHTEFPDSGWQWRPNK